MYLEHFSLKEMPFAITPGTAFVFASRAHQEALNTLLVAVQGGEGFVKITGEVGTGKTVLCRRFLDILNRRGIATAYVPNPAMQPATLLLALANELGIRMNADVDEYSLHKRINQALMRVAERGSSVVVCMDEAQSMPLETLEAVRLLSNLETEKRKLLQLVLLGQPELDDKLHQHSLRQLHQRITFEYALGGLSLRETDRYVAHRLAVAGYNGPDLTTSASIRLLHQASGGVPRLINILCHKALLSVFGEGGHVILPRHIRAAASDTGAARALGFLPVWLTQPRAWTGAVLGRESQ
ncbi:MAG TPA: AAA family ATPase [Rhodocyclaceae bacterium]|nr:AAA family ATPase [Rhodocyclaceae bacterium]